MTKESILKLLHPEPTPGPAPARGTYVRIWLNGYRIGAVVRWHHDGRITVKLSNGRNVRVNNWTKELW